MIVVATVAGLVPAVILATAELAGAVGATPRVLNEFFKKRKDDVEEKTTHQTVN